MKSNPHENHGRREFLAVILRACTAGGLVAGSAVLALRKGDGRPACNSCNLQAGCQQTRAPETRRTCFAPHREKETA